MSIKVRYFASLKESIGRSEDECVVTKPLSARAVWQQLNPDLAMPDNLLVAINMHYAEYDAVVENGDELAFFPPVTGG